MTADPLALLRWWRAVRASHSREPEALVLCWHLNGVEYLVRATDLDAVASLLESSVPPGHGDTSLPPGNPSTAR